MRLRILAVALLSVTVFASSPTGEEGPNTGIRQVDIENYLRGGNPTVVHTGSRTTALGETLEGTTCVKDPKGRPVTGIEWFMSFFANDPSAGSHTSGTLDGDGCFDWSLEVKVLPADLLTSDGDQVWLVDDFSG